VRQKASGVFNAFFFPRAALQFLDFSVLYEISSLPFPSEEALNHSGLFPNCSAVKLAPIFCLSLSFLAPPVRPQEPKPTPTKKSDAQARPAGDKTPPTTPSTPHVLDSADIEAFFDGIIPLQLERSDVAGASVLVMKDGKLLLQKGYGYSNFKDKKPVDPAATIFRLASISKLFTWVAVMQLQEQGKLDLDTDINQYLDFQMRPAFGRPITLRNLMTHTGGFEEEVRDIILVKPKLQPSLRDFLIHNQPRRLFPPGIVPGYSNYGVGLGSYIVQRISGKPFEQYVADHIFAPLGMTHSTFFQPPPKDLESLPSEGYRGSTVKDPVGFEIFNPVGAGGVSSTAADMGRFGLALLNGGELEGKRILKPETLAAMYTPQFRANDQMPALGMGFYETWRNDLRWIGHEGDLIAFHSLFFIERSQKLILFISFNSAGGAGKARPELVQMFTDRYFPSEKPQQFITIPDKELKSLEGTYQSTRRADSTKTRLINLFSQRTASLDKDGVLQLGDVKDLRGHTIKWKPIGKNLFQQIDGQRRLFAIRDGAGKVIRLAYDFPGVQAERIAWLDSAGLVYALCGASVVILAAVILGSLFRVGRRLLFKKRPKPAPLPGTVWLPLTSRIAAWLWLALLGGIFAFIATTGDDIAPPTEAWDKYLYLVNAVTTVAILFSLFAIGSGMVVWFRSGLRRITQIKFSLVALACLVLSWLAIHWNVVGPATRI
jgi:CubicO group peptidase (beta-lactamase class C family)